MKRTLAVCLLALPLATSCTSYSVQHFVGTDEYEIARVEAPGGAVETYRLRDGRSLEVITEYERERPFLGFQVQELDKTRADQRGVKPYSGLLVTGTYSESSARLGGVLANDVLLAIDGNEVVYTDQLSAAVAKLGEGQEVLVRLLRGHTEIDVTLVTKMLRENVRDRQNISLRAPPPSRRPYAGVNLRGVPSVWAERMFGEPRNAVVVAEVEVGSPAWLAGIRGGDLIEAVDGEPVPEVDELSRRIAAKGDAGESMVWQVRREPGHTFEAEIELEDYSGTSGLHIPILFHVNNGTYEDRWSIGWGLIMGNRNNYIADQQTRRVLTRNRFSMLFGLFKVDTRPDETRVRLLWFISFDT
ncbi:MAG: PDZ domain-containing protein [Planctomycetes bacterium]|nr:PDZ domain-containing protein [Planctomycetota bacterium]